MTDFDAKTRVAAGVAWLDENYSDWRDKVEILDLNIKNSCKCVLGQVFSEEAQNDNYGLSGGYYWAVYDPRVVLNMDAAVELGFDVRDDEDFAYEEEEFSCLQREWEKVLANPPVK